MSTKDKNRRCENNDRITQEMNQRRIERERFFEYDLRQNNYRDDDANRQPFKRQLTSTSRIDEYDTNDLEDNQFMVVSKGSKRKQQRLNNKEIYDKQDDVLPPVDHATPTTASSHGGRLFINSKSRTNKNQNNHTDIYHAQRYQHAKERKNKNTNMTSDDETDFDSRTAVQRTNIIENENEKDNPIDEQENENNENEKYHISKHALQYAVEHHLPPIHIECQPKIEDHHKGTEIIKSLFGHTEKDFRNLNKDYQHPVGFDYWYINKYGNLTCFTHHTELFVYLCDPNKYPSSINNITITPSRPKHLPSKHSLVLKFVPNYIILEEVQKEINTLLQSTFNIEEMKGSKTEKFRHIRLELKSTSEYKRMLTDKQIAIEGYLIEIQEFLAPPRLLICSKYNDPGHIRKNCTFQYDACRRCGENRAIGDHNECKICCHRCKQDHLSTDYRCKFLIDYRRSLLQRLKEKPNLLPINVRMFIPADCRDPGSKYNKILTNPEINNINKMNHVQQHPFNMNSFPWPTITGKQQIQSSIPINECAIWDELKYKQAQIDKLKDDFKSELQNQQTKYSDHLKK